MKEQADNVDIITFAIYNVLYLNEINCIYINRIKEVLDKNDKESQKIYGAIARRIENYENSISKILGSKKLYFACFNDAMDEKIIKFTEKYRKAIQIALKSNGLTCFEELAAIETAYTFVDFSIKTIDKIVKDCIKYSKEIVNLRSYRMIEILSILSDLSKWKCIKLKVKNDINLSKDIACIKTFKEFQTEFSKANIFYESIKKAKEYECMVQSIC